MEMHQDRDRRIQEVIDNDDCDGSIEERFSYDSFPVGRDIDYGLGEGIYNE